MRWEDGSKSFKVLLEVILVGSASLVHQIAKKTYHIRLHVLDGLLVVPGQISIGVKISQCRVVPGVEGVA